MTDSTHANVLSDPERIAALRRSGLLDTPAQEEFDRLTRLAARMLDVPIALVSVVEEDRQFFKSAHGVTERETPLSHSFCQHVVRSDAPLVVEDARVDPLVRENLAVRDLGVVSYAGVPLRTPDGHILGSFCAISLEPRRWSDDDVRALDALAAVTMDEVGLRMTADALAAHQQKLAESEARAKTILSSSLDAIISMGPSGRVLEWNDAAEKIFGYTHDEAVGQELAELIMPPGLRSAHREGLRRHLETGVTVLLNRRGEITAIRADGSDVPVELTIVRSDVDGEPLFTGFVRDLSDHQATRDALQASQQRLQAVVSSAPMILFALDATGRFTMSEGAVLATLGMAPSETLGRSVDDVYRDAPEVLAACRRALAGETFSATVDVGPLVFEVAYYAQAPSDEGGDAVIGVATDVTRRTRIEAQVAHLAYHDHLTGLPNRARLEAEIDSALAGARAHGWSIALLFIDLDDFKAVNDSLGHAAGDEVLRQVANRLSTAVRRADRLFRHSGDEFMLLLDQVRGDAVQASEVVAEKVLAAFDLPFHVEGRAFDIRASVGISCSPRDGEDFGTLIRRADVAMYTAKASGRGTFAHYTPTEDSADVRLTMRTALRRALHSGEFLLHFQPIFDLRRGELSGVEALIRWQSPTGGMVPPGDFIPVAETSGLIGAIGDWVLSSVCDQVSAWLRAGLQIPVAFNLSAYQLRTGDFAARLGEIMNQKGIDPRMLAVEMTESAAIEDDQRIAPILRRMRELGVRLSIDDFGAGYSSLGRLRGLAFDTLKIDRSLLVGVPRDESAATVFRAVRTLADGLQMDAVAEGVETEEQRRFLLDIGIRYAQGYHLARPMPASAIVDLFWQRAG